MANATITTLVDTVNFCRGKEAAKRSNKELCKTKSGITANKVKQDKFQGHQGKNKNSKGKQATGNSTSKKCIGCGGNCQDRTKCPAKGKPCSHCQRPGHFASV